MTDLVYWLFAYMLLIVEIHWRSQEGLESSHERIENTSGVRLWT
jgi:hypothetical protein